MEPGPLTQGVGWQRGLHRRPLPIRAPGRPSPVSHQERDVSVVKDTVERVGGVSREGGRAKGLRRRRTQPRT